MNPGVRPLTAIAAISLVIASLIHFGYLVEGYRHQEAAIAEAVIGGVMLVGLGSTWGPLPWGRRVAVGTLIFGLLGTSVGMFTILVGIGPQTTPDIVYHIGLIITLVVGLVVALRTPEVRRGPSPVRGRRV